MKTPIFQILKFILEEQESNTKLTDEHIVAKMISLSNSTKVQETLRPRLIKGWVAKGIVTIYDTRADTLSKIMKQFNPQAMPFWFQVPTFQEFKKLWDQGKYNFYSQSSEEPPHCYQIIRKAFDGSNRIIFEMLHTHTSGSDRLFDLYTPQSGNDPIVFTGRDLDIGHNNVLYGSSQRSEHQVSRPRGLFFRHDTFDPLLNRHLFGLTIGSMPEFGEPVSAKFYCFQLDDLEEPSSENLRDRVKFGTEQDVRMMFPVTNELICEFIDNQIKNRGVLSFQTQIWNEKFRAILG